jgi:hypothetical protein
MNKKPKERKTGNVTVTRGLEEKVKREPRGQLK